MFVIAITVCLLSTVLCTGLVFAAWRHASAAYDMQLACARAAGKLNALSGRVIALEGANDSLTAQLRKLRGKVYQASGQPGLGDAFYENSETPAPPDVGLAPAELRKPATLFVDTPPYCENWQRAQVDGPMSQASRCDCNYCAEMRFRRDQVKLDLMPAARDATLGVSKR